MVLISRFQIITFIVLHSCQDSELLLNDNERLIAKKEIIASCGNCGVVTPKNFTVNLGFYLESRSNNTCLYKKVAIDSIGNIKNCPSQTSSYGNINSIDLIDVLKSEEYLSLGKISKNQIEVCKICEFRNVCSDCRMYLQDSENLYSKPLKCNYDPKSTTWSA